MCSDVDRPLHWAWQWRHTVGIAELCGRLEDGDDNHGEDHHQVVDLRNEDLALYLHAFKANCHDKRLQDTCWRLTHSFVRCQPRQCHSPALQDRCRLRADC